MPFENVTREGRIFWLGEASAVLLTDDLNALGTSAITREERREAFDRLQVPAAAVLTDATVIRLGQLVGASEVVVGSLQLEGDALVVKARTITLDSARVRHNAIERGPLAELYATFERIARQLAPGSTRSSDEVEAAASADCGVRELHQGAAGRHPEDRHHLLDGRHQRAGPASIAPAWRSGTSTRNRGIISARPTP